MVAECPDVNERLHDVATYTKILVACLHVVALSACTQETSQRRSHESTHYALNEVVPHWDALGNVRITGDGGLHAVVRPNAHSMYTKTSLRGPEPDEGSGGKMKMETQITSLVELLSPPHSLNSTPSFPFISNLIQSSPIDFYSSNHQQQLTLNPDRGPWAVLPTEWQSFFTQAFHQDSDPTSLIRALASCDSHPSFPPSLADFLYAVRSLSLPRQPHPQQRPLFSHPRSPEKSQYESASASDEDDCVRMLKPRTGIGPKKDREIGQILRLIRSLRLTTSHALDLGAGRGHLSQALGLEGFEVLSIDANSQFELTTAAASFQTTRLDADGIAELLASQPPSLVVGLHACGDLSPAILSGFLRDAQTHHHTLVLVGCCYNLLTLANIPRSLSFLSSHHLQLAAQTPASWSANWGAFERSIVKLAYRSRWASELAPLEPPRHGRLADRHYESYTQYRVAAIAKSGVEPKRVLKRSEEDEAMDLWKLSVAWTIRAVLGPCVESLIVLERFVSTCTVIEETGGQRRVELVNVFDQCEGQSPRNLAIVIRSLL
ncbi:hypothetical protein CROQUDRAFT_111025 [Cronartium quercuum f. sp. fusiforme G11]|uniref:Methyltransferase domain-containing protein n=1 Tax=Cronartium quercuum f. sp. fusiforme G11 TaxID=708437 RepID=A0A9P6T7M6_9BASI|nr:hypothetical protein CROQUDRAFT_111025 [Cronartium quercuum f. sp. fusiforme G11]